MNEEYFIQQAEQVSPIPAPLVEYIDQKIALLDQNFYGMGSGGQHARKLIDPQEYQQERATLQKMKDDMLKGQHTGVATLLQTERAQAAQEFTSLQQQIRPRSTDSQRETMQGDLIYFAIQENIMHEQRILTKAAAVLDQDDKAYLERKIEGYKSEQQKTERGSVLKSMAEAQGRINSVGSLQKLIPQAVPTR